MAKTNYFMNFMLFHSRNRKQISHHLLDIQSRQAFPNIILRKSSVCITMFRNLALNKLKWGPLLQELSESL